MKFEVTTSYGRSLKIERFRRITNFKDKIFVRFHCLD